ncbi:MAG: hypothetical protein ACKVH8_24220 [Pirellulales bacterium]
MPESPFAQPETTVLAYRGYNYTNLGRSHEMINHPEYGDFYRKRLQECSIICSETLARKIDLVSRVEEQIDTTLKIYSDAVGLVVAVEMAQVDIMQSMYQLDLHKIQMTMGYSLGELTALVVSGCLTLKDALSIPLSLAQDSAELADDCTLAVIFCLRQELPAELVQMHCQKVNAEGEELIGISAILSPNSLIVVGEGDSVDRLKAKLSAEIESRIFVKKNEHKWPPLHTSLTWRKNIPTRAAMFMTKMQSGFTAPSPPVLSLVTGACSYNEVNLRETIGDWVDHPQNLWEAVYETLVQGTNTIIHLGPAPNIIPATYHRLADNVELQTRGSLHKRTLATFVNRPWLKSLLPEKAALLRAPSLKHFILEDWLLDEAGKE